MRTLISWIATRNDFFVRDKHLREIRAEDKVNEQGPHANLYKHFKFFDRHILLSQFDQNTTDPRRMQSEFLASYLRKEFNKDVELRYLNISDINDVGGIKGKCDDLVASLKPDGNLSIFISPGTPGMQIAWYLQATEEQENAKIEYFRIRQTQFTADKKSPKKEVLTPISADYAKGTNIIFQSKKDAPFKTKSQDNTYKRALLVASNNQTTVLIKGDTGTGKEYLAKYIHQKSNRKDVPFIAINCASYHGDLLETRLFGYAQGAFTDAKKSTPGVFEDANGGTLFLDEIGEISSQMQASILRVLEERKVTRVGSTKERKIDIRIIAGSHKDLWEMCEQGTFRIDLFYRLAVAELTLPSLQAMSKHEIRKWTKHLINERRKNWGKTIKISEEVWEYLENHEFIGNLRELRNIIDNFFLFAEGGIAQLYHIPKRKRITLSNQANLTMKEIQKRHAKLVLDDSDGNKSLAAKRLGITRVTLENYIN